MVIAVPVKKFSLTQFALSATPVSAIQFATSKMLPNRKTAPINKMIMIFLLVNVISKYPPKINNKSFS